MTAPKLNVAQISLANYLVEFGHLLYEGPEYHSAEILSEYGLVEYNSSHHIQLRQGVTRVPHPSGTVWLNSNGKVLAVE